MVEPTGESPLDDSALAVRPVIMSMIIILGLSVLFGRLLYLQIVKGARNFVLAEGNRIRQIQIPAPRGIIYDRSNNPLVKNTARYSLAIIPANWSKNEQERHELYNKLLGRLDEQGQQILKPIFESNSSRITSVEPVELIANLTVEQAIQWEIDFFDVPGVTVLKQPKREYSAMPSIGHVLGYLGKIDEQTLKGNTSYFPTDLIGKSGLEMYYEAQLRGQSGAQQFEINARGQLQRTLAHLPAVQGNDLRLTLDKGLQEKAAQSLQSDRDPKELDATAIAMNPKTGELLAMVSLPDFDPDIFIKPDNASIAKIFNDFRRPLINRAISGEYPSGSTIKPVWAASGLQERVVTPQFKIDTPPAITIGQFNFSDWKDHGVTDVRRAIAESNNIFFYAIVGGWDKIKGLGIERMERYLQSFHFGKKTGVDLPGEADGFVPSPAWKLKTRKERWYVGDSYHLGIGQGDILVTPLQLLVAESALVNGGNIVKPHLVQQIVNHDGQVIEEIAPAAIDKLPIDEQFLQVVKEGMRLTITEGSGRSLNDIKDKNGQPIEVAGKTGTAQFGNEGKTHAWFIGFAPWQDPEIGVIILVEGGGEGHAVAAPVAKSIFEYWFKG